MPVLTFPNFLLGRPNVKVFIGLPTELREAREAQGLLVISPLPAVALVDTGSARSLIATSLLNRLNIPTSASISAREIVGVGGVAFSTLEAAVSLAFADGPPISAASAMPVCTVPDAALAGFGIEVVLGRDFLARVLMVVYNGPENRLTLAF
jgi:hypothetical protein